MMCMIFQWDSKKAAANKLKHGVGFEEARSAFDDTGAVLQPDPLHSDDEDRFVLMGLSIVPRRSSSFFVHVSMVMSAASSRRGWPQHMKPKSTTRANHEKA